MLQIKILADGRGKYLTEMHLNTLETSDELDLLNKIVEYEKEHNVKIL